MAVIITDPKTGLVVSNVYQANNFEDAKKARRWLTFFASRVVNDTACAALPASPVEGQTVIVAGSATYHANTIARYSTELRDWEYLTPWNGLSVTDMSGNAWFYGASGWAQPTSASTSLPTWLLNHPDAPPSGLHADSAEFDSLPSGWTSMDELSSVNPPTWSAGTGTVSIEGGALKIIPTSKNWRVLHHFIRPITPAKWRVVTRISANRVPANYGNYGLSFVDAAGRSAVYNIDYSGQLEYYLPYSASSPAVLTREFDACWLRATNNGTALVLDYSLDGRVWFNFTSRTIGGDIQVPVKYGLAASGSNPVGGLGCDMFRVWSL